MSRALLIWGTSSGAGKSWITTALCRVAARRGLKVAPFKAQNMSNNARVAVRSAGLGDAAGAWGEIGSAQYFQALAAGVTPESDHNPVLLKPERDTASQVVLNGAADAALSRMPWRQRSAVLAPHAEAALRRLMSAHDLVVIEGAGSPAEINLAPQDYVNLGAARWAQSQGPTAALLVSDIDRGGSFAQVYGTWALLPGDLRPLLQGYVLNRFRGDPALLAPGPTQMQALCGLPLAAVLPMLRDHGLPEEDSLFLAPEGRGEARLRVAVLAPPAVSNHDEFAPLSGVPGLRLVWAREAAALEGADWIVLPGSKQTGRDLAWLREQGLEGPIRRHAQAGKPVLGVCGGLQMLGHVLHDPAGHDGWAFDAAPGLDLLPLRTTFGPRKRLTSTAVRFGATTGVWAALGAVEAPAYEIRCGDTQVLDGPSTSDGLRPVLFDPEGRAIGWQQGSVLGVYAHGLFEAPAVLQALFGTAVPTLDQAFERLADHAEAHFDPVLLQRWLHGPGGFI